MDMRFECEPGKPSTREGGVMKIIMAIVAALILAGAIITG
jgi:hypothetical protein